MQHQTDVKFFGVDFWCKIHAQVSLQNLKRRFGGLIIWLSNENMKNFNFQLKHWCWIKIINTTGCDPHWSWAGVIQLKLTTVESINTQQCHFFNLHPAVSNLPHVHTSCRVKLTLGRVRWILFDTIAVQCQHLWVWPSIEVASVLNLTPLELSLNPS